MSRLTGHAIPATLMETGRVVTVAPLELVGPAEALTGLGRWREVYTRFRRQHPRRISARLTVTAWRTGVALHGRPLRERAR